MSDQSLQQLLVTNFGLLPSGYTGSQGVPGVAGFVGSQGIAGVGSSAPAMPVIDTIQVTDSGGTVLDDTAVDVAGGYIRITGTGFSLGCSILVGTTPVVSTTFVNSTQIVAQVPAMAAGTYVVFLVNGNGQITLKVPGITFSALPIWVTGSTLVTRTSGTAFSTQLSATGAVSYALAAGSTLPAGVTLSSSGLLSGTSTVAQNTTFNFTVNADDAEFQTSPRTFTMSVFTQVLLQYQLQWSSAGIGQVAWDYGRDPKGLVFNTTDRNGISMNLARWPTAPGSVRITYVGTTINIDSFQNYTSIILPGQSGGIETNANAYQMLTPPAGFNWGSSSHPFVAALNGETVIMTVYLLPA